MRLSGCGFGTFDSYRKGFAVVCIENEQLALDTPWGFDCVLYLFSLRYNLHLFTRFISVN